MYVFCQRCGAPLAQTHGLDSHECDFEQFLAFQTQCAHIEIEHGLEAQVAAWEREPRVANRLAFARYMRDRVGAGAGAVHRGAA
jgi:hypothetical protein